MLYPENEGTTEGSDLVILNLKIVCNSQEYPLICPTNKQHTITSEGAQIQCSISGSIPSSTTCGLYGQPNIISTGDIFIPALENTVSSEDSKYGDTGVSLFSVEGKKIVIKITPQRSGETTTDDLFVYGLTVDGKELTCKANQKIYLESGTGTNLECSTTEEIDGNVRCKLTGSASIFSTSDTFGRITNNGDIVTSSFGQVKVGLDSVKGTTVTIILTPEYKGSTTVDISGLKINDEKILDCPDKYLDMVKEGNKLTCTISQSMEDNTLCILTSYNLHSSAFNNLVIDESNKERNAGASKYGRVNIGIQSVIGTQITILITTTVTANTESTKFTILGLSLTSDNKDYTMTCSKSSQIELSREGTPFACTITTKMNGGKECKLKGVPSFISEGDTFSDISLSTEAVISSFGDITISPVSIIGNKAKIKLVSAYGGTTVSSVLSIDNLKWNGATLNCQVGNNINFSNKPEITCTLPNDMNGNIPAQLLGTSPTITMEENSKDIFGNIIISTSSITSSFGQLKVSLSSVVGDKVTISLESEYIGEINNLNINGLKLNNKLLVCDGGSTLLQLKNSDGTSNANIQCHFSDSYYSEETRSPCTLTGSPNPSIKLFTTQIITSQYQVTYGIRNFGETIIYLHSIKGTTVHIQLKPSSMNGKVRPIISNLKLKAGTTNYDVKCDISDKIQLYKNSATKVKCYISNTINTNTACSLINQDNSVTITATNGDLFGNIIIDTGTLNVNPSSPTYGNTKIEITNIIGTEIKIDLTVSSETEIDNANPVIHDLYLGDTELYCVATQTLTFINNKATMTCTSSTEITCTTCQLSGNPTIISLGDSDDTFGDASIENKSVEPTSSTLGNINIKLDEVIGTDVYITLTSSNNGQDTTQVDVNNLYIDGQPLTCSDNIKFSTTPTRMKCTIEEPISYDKPVEITGTPSIKIHSDQESVDVVEITTTTEEIKAKSNSGLNIKLISVKENYVTITIDATSFTRKTLLYNFNLNGLTINDIPFQINLDQIYLGGGPVEIKTALSEPIQGSILCELKGTETAEGSADGKIFGPISNPSGNTVFSTFFKFGKGTLSLLEVHGYLAKIQISSTKSALTQNTVLNDLYINNIRLTCRFTDGIEFSSYGADVECQLGTPVDGSVTCTLYYKGDGDDNFEEIIIDEDHKTVISTYNNFGDVIIGLIDVNIKNVKISVKTRIAGITTTNNVEIKNLYLNNKRITCQYNENIEFIREGTELDCTSDTIEQTDTYTLTGINPEIISFADSFGSITIDSDHSVIRSTPKEIDETIITLSSVAENKVSIKIKVTNEIYTNLRILNLKIKNRISSEEYSLTCPTKYVNLIAKNEFTNYIICDTSTKIIKGLYFTLVNNDDVSIESYDNFENIIIENNEVISTKFGDTIINPISSQIVIEVIPTNQETTLGILNIDKLKLTSSSQFSLDCQTQETIELKSSGTKLYCTIKGVISLSGVNDENPTIESEYTEDSFGNILLGQSFYETQVTNCFAIYDKTSCETNSNCIFSKDTYGFCDIKYENLQSSNNILTSNECVLYANEDKCNNNENCFWNMEYKYTCKSKGIKNCQRLLPHDLSKCETCDDGYELNADSTKCILVGEVYYPCHEYSSYSSCSNKPQCEYHDESYNYCTSSDLVESNAENDCHLYITREACNEQDSCIWKTNLNSGCSEKYIENCVKLRESDPTSCEKCEEGYYVLGGTTCTKKSVGENEQCEKLIDDIENCVKLPFCEYSRNAFCYGGDGCYRYLSKELCERAEFCWWNSGNWNRCKIKKIPNCLELSEDDATTCIKCQDGYILKNYNTTCTRIETGYGEEDVLQCYYEDYDEGMCNNNVMCEYSNRHRCESYNENTQCFLYLEQNLCEEDQRCYWITEDESRCQIKGINNCVELKNENIQQCKKCKDGYELINEDTECKESSSMFITSKFLISVLILLLV